jgi:hypothetical protein
MKLLAELLAEREVASLLKVNRATLRRWRGRNAGPRYLRLGPKLIRYRRDDLALFLDSGPASSRQNARSQGSDGE